MVGHEGVAAAREAERVLQGRAAGQDRLRTVVWQHDGPGYVAPRAPDRHHPAVGDLADRVVDPGANCPVMQQDGVGDPGQACQRIGVLEGDRLVRRVAAGQDERSLERLEKQDVQGRVRQHEAQGGRPGRHRGRHRHRPAARPALQYDDRPRRAREKGQLLRSDLAQVPGRSHVHHHHGERPVLPVLAPAQRGDRVLLPRVDSEVITTETLDGYDPAFAEHGDGAGERRTGRRRAGTVEQLQGRPTHRAAHGFGMKAPVGRVLVLPAAVGAQGEAGHGRARPVVGHGVHDGEAGTARGAVQERVAEPAVGRIVQLAEAVRTGGRVRRHHREPGPTHGAAPDRKPGFSGRCPRLTADLIDTSHRRRSAQRRQQRRHRVGGALHLEDDPGGIVADPTGQTPTGRLPPDEGSEPDPLHQSRHVGPGADGAGYVGGGHAESLLGRASFPGISVSGLSI